MQFQEFVLWSNFWFPDCYFRKEYVVRFITKVKTQTCMCFSFYRKMMTVYPLNKNSHNIDINFELFFFKLTLYDVHISSYNF